MAKHVLKSSVGDYDKGVLATVRCMSAKRSRSSNLLDLFFSGVGAGGSW